MGGRSRRRPTRKSRDERVERARVYRLNIRKIRQETDQLQCTYVRTPRSVRTPSPPFRPPFAGRHSAMSLPLGRPAPRVLKRIGTTNTNDSSAIKIQSLGNGKKRERRRSSKGRRGSTLDMGELALLVLLFELRVDVRVVEVATAGGARPSAQTSKEKPRRHR